MILRFKHFHDSLNIVLILPSGREFFCTKYVQFSLTFRGFVQTHCATLNVNSTFGGVGRWGVIVDDENMAVLNKLFSSVFRTKEPL